MDLNQIMKLANDPTVQKLLQSLLSRYAGGQGSMPDTKTLQDALGQLLQPKPGSAQ
jgi:hypothetical protein